MAATMDIDMINDCPFLSLPIELRHKIYGFASQTTHGAERQLRTWYEKQDRTEQIAAGWVPPTVPQPIHPIFSDFDEPIEDEDQAGDAEGEPQISINDEDEEDPEDEDQDQYEDEGDEEESEVEHNEGAEAAAEVNTGEEAEEEEDEEEQEEVAENEDLEEDAVEDTNADTVTAAIPTRPYPHSKWRHVTKLVQVSHCPPPLNLLQTCEQIREEALAYHYDKCIMTFNATRSLEHQTFVEEEVVDRILNAAYSPLEKLRKACVVIVWDTMWINSKGQEIVEPIWKFQFLSRVRKAVNLLSRMPQLQKAVVKYYDSDASVDAQATRCEVEQMLSDFQLNRPQVEIDLQIKIEEARARVSSRSVMGKQRMHFKRILENGQNFH